jgi:hypothetical protein
MAVITGTSGNDILVAHPGGGGTLVVALSGTSAEGVAPHFNLLVNGTVMLANQTAPTTVQQFVVSIPSGTSVTSVGIEYLNDVQNEYAFEDRNLWIDSVSLNNQALQASSATYLRSADGSVVAGQFGMVWGGTLTFTGSAVTTAAAAGGGGGALENNTINAGAGLDMALYGGSSSSYSVVHTATGFSVTGMGVTDTLTGVERLAFDNVRIALDVDGVGGMAYRLYRAAFDRTPDIGGLGFHINAMDHGWGIGSIAQNFVDSPEFQTTYGNIDNTQFVTLLYNNVLDRNPDQAGLDFHVNNLNSGAIGRHDVLAQFSESPENKAAVIGTIQDGMVYIPVV